MKLHINKIEINNFRSARNVSLTPGRLAVLVGRNDSGKSNILRALNLFFNGKTDISEDLNFDVDHNVFNQPNRKAKQITIRLQISMPRTYRATNGDYVVWEKRWRSEGLVHDEYVGMRRTTGSRGGNVPHTLEIPAKSNVHALLRNINFVYVPAIKDLDYFSDLRASIYNTIAEVSNREFRDASQEFEQSIFRQLEDLTTTITNSLGFKSRLALPNDMSHIFESLDFLSDGQKISLDARGDGIKARHIPLILKFMADKKHGLQVKGSPPHHFIWGYEEPENNLELSSCVELADQFWEFVNGGISQVFLTTHSPVFYNLHRKQQEGEARISCHHIYRDADEDGTKETEELGDLDERMGTTALFAPKIAELEDEVRRQVQARAEVEELANAERRKIFVEGTSDQTVIRKALDVFAPAQADEIDVETSRRAGVSYVEAMLQSWRNHRKYNSTLPRAVGLLDADEPGRIVERSWNKVKDNRKSAKCFLLPVPPHLAPALKLKFNIPVVLESLYDRALWDWADAQGHLEDRDPLTTLPADLSRQILTRQTVLDSHVEEAWSIFVHRQVPQVGKTWLAQKVAGLDDADFKVRFAFMEPLLREIIAYLFPPAEQGSADEPSRQAQEAAQG